MKVRYLQSMGLPKGEAIAAGAEGDVSDAEAERLIAKGIAEPVASKRASKASTATSSKAEAASKRKAEADTK